MMYERLSTILVGMLLLSVSALSGATEEPVILWDESVDADLSSTLGEPTIIPISEPGAYVMYINTGPLSPVKVEDPTGRPARQGGFLQRMDANGDGRLQRSELTSGSNIELHFDVYDIDGDGEVAFDEAAQFTLAGDGSDMFSFDQADGINLVAIIINSYDTGGPNNDVTAFGFMDSKSGQAVETPGVQLRDSDDLANLRRARTNVNSVNPSSSGPVEVYDQFDLWKIYRRNDDTIYFRVGEGQEMATTEVTFVFE